MFTIKREPQEELKERARTAAQEAKKINTSWSSPTPEEVQYTENLIRWINDLGWKISFEMSDLFDQVAVNVTPLEKPLNKAYLMNSSYLSESFCKIYNEVPQVRYLSRAKHRSIIVWTPY